MNSKVPFIVGYVSLKSVLTLEEVGKIISDRLFGSLEFGGKDLEIHEEIPAIFIQSPILGLKIVLDGYAGFDKNSGFNLSIAPCVDIIGVKYNDIRIDIYLFHLLKTALKDVPEIEVFEN
ncbi:MAG: hypothetical protein ABJB86_19995 [Bacteroidota bacterium]